MIKIELNGKEFNMPTTWEELTVERYVKLLEANNLKDDIIFEELFVIKVIEALCGCESDELNDLPITELGKLSEGISFLDTTPNYPMKKDIEIDGEIWSLPNNPNELKIGEYISIRTLIERDGEHKSLPYILAILFRKNIDGKRVSFNAMELEKNANIMRRVPVSEVLQSVAFFLNLNEISIDNTKDYSEKQN